MIPQQTPFKKGDKVVAYCRFSEGDEQGLKNTSTDEQEAAIREYCSRYGLDLVKVFADPFASGRSVAKRDKYLEMLSFLLHGKKKDIQGVILWDYERYGRNYDRAQLDAAQLRMKGYKLFSMQQPITDNSPFAHVLESMYFASAQNQSDMISADVKRALQSNFTKWKVIPKTNIPDGWLPVPVKIGYYTDGRERIGHRVKPDPEYKDKIRDAVKARLAGASMTQVRMILGGKFLRPSIKATELMKKTLLYGSITYGGTTMDDFCEPIIDKETFDKLQVYNAAEPKRRRSPGAGVYSLNRALLSGLLVCGQCGERMHLDRRKAKGHLYETYYCNSYHIGVRREDVEDLIIEKSIGMLSGKEWENTVSALTAGLQGASDNETDKSYIEREIREIDRKLGRLCDSLLSTDKAPEFLMTKMKELEERKKELSAILSNQDDKTEKVIEMAERFRVQILDILQSEWSTTDEKRDALSAFIQQITVLPASGKSCKLIVEHGLPGFLKVAGIFGEKEKRPCDSFANTCNMTTVIMIVK